MESGAAALNVTTILITQTAMVQDLLNPFIHLILD
jgi:hypothetical protein